MAKVAFPMEVVGEFTVARKDNPSGMFFYRYIQTQDLLQLPDYSGGDMTKENIESSLKNATAFMRPLRAISIMMNVVALEDFIRHMGPKLLEINDITNYLPNLHLLSHRTYETDKKTMVLLKSGKGKEFAPTHFTELNKLYMRSIGVEPIDGTNIKRLDDLVRIRNITAHGAAYVTLDQSKKFNYYDIGSDQIINPTLDFLSETNLFLYHTGRDFIRVVRDKIFSQIIPKLDMGWKTNTPKIVLDLIVFFDYFEKLVGSDQLSQGQNAHDFLLSKCIGELANIYSDA